MDTSLTGLLLRAGGRSWVPRAYQKVGAYQRLCLFHHGQWYGGARNWWM